MPGPQVLCVVILIVMMTIAFVIGSILVKLLFYSSTHGFDDNSIDSFYDLQESSSAPAHPERAVSNGPKSGR
jgi:hypothetical protein